jgi:hypothetical protein
MHMQQEEQPTQWAGEDSWIKSNKKGLGFIAMLLRLNAAGGGPRRIL